MNRPPHKKSHNRKKSLNIEISRNLKKNELELLSSSVKSENRKTWFGILFSIICILTAFAILYLDIDSSTQKLEIKFQEEYLFFRGGVSSILIIGACIVMYKSFQKIFIKFGSS